MDDYFAVLGVPRTPMLDAADLQQRFHELSRRHHPDFHRAAGVPEEAAVLATSALINRAYRALRDPLSRLQHLIALEEGGMQGAGDAREAPPPLLLEMMDIQEALEEAKASGLDDDARRRLAAERVRLIDRDEAERAAVVARMAEWDLGLDAAARAVLRGWFKQRLATRAYLRTVIDDLGNALGEDDGSSHGPHRRH